MAAAGGATIGALRAILGIDTVEFDKGLKQAQTNLAQFGQATQKLGQGVQGAVGAILNMKTALAALATGAMVGFIKKGVQVGDEIAETAEKIGITTESLQKLRFATSLNGVSAEQFDLALLQLNKRLGDINNGSSDAAVALGKLGIRVDDIRGMKADQVFLLISDQLRKVSDTMEKGRLSTELFGKAGQQLIPTMNLGSSGIQSLGNEAKKLGIILSEETIKKSEKANDEFIRIGDSLKIAGVQIAVGFLPALTQLREIITSQEFQIGVRTLGENFGKFVQFIVDHGPAIAKAGAALIAFKTGAALAAPFGPAAAAFTGLAAAITAVGVASNATGPDIEKLDGQIAALDAQRAALTREFLKPGLDDQGIKRIDDQLKVLDDKLKEATKLRAELVKASTKVTVTPLDQPQPLDISPIIKFDPKVAEEVQNLDLKIKNLKDGFQTLAPGFVDAAVKLKVFENGIVPLNLGLETLSPQLLDMNATMVVMQGLTLTKPQNEFIKLSEVITATNAAMEKGGLSAMRMAQLSEVSAELQQKIWSVAATSIGNSFESMGNSLSTMSDNWSRLASIGKAIGATIAFVNSYIAASNALATAIFPANIALAAGVLASGLAMVAAIKTSIVPTRFATGGSFKVPGGIGGGDKVFTPLMLEPGERVDVTSNQQQTRNQSVTFDVRGKLFDRETIVDIIHGLNSALGDNHVIRFAPV